MVRVKTHEGGNMRGSTIFILILVAIIALFFVAKTRIPDMLANNLSKKLGVTVSIDSMGFMPSKVEARQLEIGNPRGYSLPKAFSAKEILVHAPITRYFKDDVVIEEINVNDVYLGLEFDSTSGTDGNWTQIMGNYHKNSKLEQEGPGIRKVLIKRLIFTNIQTDLLFRGEGKAKKLPTISHMEFTNVSSEGGIPSDQLIDNILAQMLKEVFLQYNLGNMLQGILQAPGSAVETILKPFTGASDFCPSENKESA